MLFSPKAWGVWMSFDCEIRNTESLGLKETSGGTAFCSEQGRYWIH